MVARGIYDTRKKEFPEILKKYHGMIATACVNAGISRETYYRWCREDPEFKEACDMIGELVKDVVENKLLKSIDADVPSSIYFFLKTRCRERGYAEYKEEPSQREQKEISPIDKDTFDAYIKYKIADGVEAELKRLGVVMPEKIIEVKDE